MRKIILLVALFVFSITASAQTVESYVGEYSYTGNDYCANEEPASVSYHLEIVDLGGGAMQVLWGRYSTDNLLYENRVWEYTRDKSAYSISVKKTSSTGLKVTIMKPSPDVPSNAKEIVLESNFRKQ